jgi:hypothetical protein
MEELMRALRVMFGALALAAILMPSARADENNKQTFLTFSGPVQVPGATLPAGTYMFKLADLQGNRHVVQIFDKDGMKLYTTILAIPDQRLEPTDKPVVMFGETPAGTPAAIKAWFYPGDTIGDEFVYPRTEAMRIARATHQPVLSRSDQSSDMKSSEVSRIDESGSKVAESEHAQPPAATTTTTTASASNMNRANERPNADQNKSATAGTTGTTTPSATDQRAAQSQSATQSQPNRPSTTAANPEQRNDQNAGHQGRLPKTASPLALYELVSGLAFAGAFGIRQLRNRL